MGYRPGVDVSDKGNINCSYRDLNLGPSSPKPSRYVD